MNILEESKQGHVDSRVLTSCDELDTLSGGSLHDTSWNEDDRCEACLLALVCFEELEQADGEVEVARAAFLLRCA